MINDITIPAGTTQQDFRDLTERLGLAISYMPLAPAAPLGLLGFDAGCCTARLLYKIVGRP